jgi:hypothetical protein
MMGGCVRVGGCEGGMGSGGRLCYTCSFSHSDDFKRLRVAHTNFFAEFDHTYILQVINALETA